jgi:hypothetical protein
MVIQEQEAFRTSRPEKNFPHYITVKTLGKWKSLLKDARRKSQVTYKGKSIRITIDFSAETLKAKKA